MNRRLAIRGLGTVWVGTALLGWGCSQPDEQPRSDKPLPFPPESDEAETLVPPLRAPVASEPSPEPVRASRRIERLVEAASRTRKVPRDLKPSSQSQLLISASDLALSVSPPAVETAQAAPEAMVAAPQPASDQPATALQLPSPTTATVSESVAPPIPMDVHSSDGDPSASAETPLAIDPFTPDAGSGPAGDEVPGFAEPASDAISTEAAEAQAPAALQDADQAEPAPLAEPAIPPAGGSDAQNVRSITPGTETTETGTIVPPPAAGSLAEALPSTLRQQGLLPKPATAPVALTSVLGPAAGAVGPSSPQATSADDDAVTPQTTARRSIVIESKAEPPETHQAPRVISATPALSSPKPAPMAADNAAPAPVLTGPVSLAAAMPVSDRSSAILALGMQQPDRPPPRVANDAASPPAVPQPALSGPVAATTAMPTAAAVLPQAREQSILGLESTGSPTGESALLAAPPREAPAGFGTSVPVFDYQDELILELQVKGIDATDTIIAYDTRQGIYLPLGTLVRILDLAVRISEEGNFAYGWALSEDRVIGIDLRQQVLTVGGREEALPPGFAVAFDGEMYIRGVDLARLLPLRIETDLRSQQVLLETLEPFPFEERMKREARRERLGINGEREEERWPRHEAPYLLASVPSVDLEIRAISDAALGERIEQDVTLAGDLAMLNARGFFSGNTSDGLTASVIELGRIDPDAELLGPLKATEFSIGDTANPTMPLGLRSMTGRGASVTNSPLQSVSVFERIDLRGILQDGYEVELYRNGILVGSTRDRVNGRYEFLQIPVDFGLNLFRLVFYGPQGQQYEELRTISVGDGRLAKGELVYKLGAIEKDVNVLGVRDPRSIAPPDRGDWRASAEVAYGVTSGLTAVASAAWLEEGPGSRWLATGGFRSGIGRFAVKADAAIGNDGASAFSGGIGGRFGRTAFTLTHSEYAGGFFDETHTAAPALLKRATELDLNAGIRFGGEEGGADIPINGRLRYFETVTGRKQLTANLRSSMRAGGFLVSNTLEYSGVSQPGIDTFYQVFGNFDLATLGRSKTRVRGSVGYALLPQPDILSAGVEVDHYLDERTSVRGSVNYVFATASPQVAASARRDFDRFSLSLDGNYAFSQKAYSLALRLGLSFGRDPMSGRFFSQRETLAGSGAISLRAYRDRDGDGTYGTGDEVLPDVDFVAFSASETTDAAGIARLTGLGHGRPVTVQVDSGTLPDITLAPMTKGVEIVPRAGRIQSLDVPIVELSEAEGKVVLVQGDTRREVSGVRLQLLDKDGKPAAFAKTEVDGYYYFEQLMPGTYTIAIEKAQAERLGICLVGDYAITTRAQSDIVVQDIEIRPCA